MFTFIDRKSWNIVDASLFFLDKNLTDSYWASFEEILENIKKDYIIICKAVV